jgi:hypothetical protein
MRCNFQNTTDFKAAAFSFLSAHNFLSGHQLRYCIEYLTINEKYGIKNCLKDEEEKMEEHKHGKN